MIPKKRITLTLLLSILSEFANKIFPLFVLHHAQKSLGVESFGSAQFGISLYEVLIPVVSFGFSTLGAIKFTSAPSERALAKGMLGSIVFWRVLFALIVFAALIFLIHTNPQYAVFSAVIFGGCFILFTSAVDFDFVFLATQKLLPYTVLLILIKLLSAGSIIIFVNDPGDAVLYCLLYLAGNACVSLIGFIVVTYKIGLSIPTGRQLKSVFLQALPYTLSTVILLSGERIDILLAGLLQGSSGAGFYAGPARLVASLTHLTGAVGRVFFSELVAKCEPAYFSRLVQLEVFSASSILFPAVVGSWFVGEALISLFFGQLFAPYASLLSLLAVGAVFHTAIHIFGYQILLVKNQIAFVNLTMLLGFSLSIASAVVLATFFEQEHTLFGIAMGIICGKALMAIAFVLRSRAYLTRLPLKETFSPLSAAIAMAVVLLGATMNGLDQWYFQILIGVGVYSVTLMALNHQQLFAALAYLKKSKQL